MRALKRRWRDFKIYHTAGKALPTLSGSDFDPPFGFRDFSNPFDNHRPGAAAHASHGT